MARTANQRSAGVDRQWDLMRSSFDGTWKGLTTWYGRYGAEMDLSRGTSDPAGSIYAIRFSDANTGVWHGTGLRFAPGGERQFPLYRHSYNLGNQCWHFPNTAGQSSLDMDASSGRAGHEVNFFTSRSRSMLVALYQREEGHSMILDSIAATAFRCQRTTADPVRDVTETKHQLFQTITGWPGMEQELRPGQWPEYTPPSLPIAAFAASSFLKHEVNGYFADKITCSLPAHLPQGPFDLNFGCLITPNSFVHLMIEYDQAHQLTRWVERRYQPTING